jgi:hypothetical protein
MKLIKGIKGKSLILLTLILFCPFSLSLTTNSKTETEEKSSNGINISEGNMKHKKMHLRKIMEKQPSTAVSPSATMNKNTVNDGVSTTGKLAQTSNVLDVATGEDQTTQDNQPSLKELGNGPVYFTGWVKYFKFSDEDQGGSTPKHFFKNTAYYEQMKYFPDINFNQTSSSNNNTNSSQMIKSPSHFLAIMFKNNINFVTSKLLQLQKTYDVLNIDAILPVVETRGFSQKSNGEKGEKGEKDKNGIQDFGNFSEGFCFKILSSTPKVETWVICSDTESEKIKFMSILKQFKIQVQRQDGLVMMSQNNKKPAETISSMMGSSSNLKEDDDDNLGVTFGKKQKIVDGYWVVLQEWTQCSLKCGGGTSTLQRMCVPPKNGGKNCDGQSVLTRPCNTQPCPSVSTTGQIQSNNTFVMKPIIKVLPFSSRPQRFSKCIIKEADLMLTQESDQMTPQDNPLIKASSNALPTIQVPVRVVMNNKTFTIFEGENYNSQIKTFSLQDTVFKRSLVHKSCFTLSESKKIAELCPFGFSTRGGSMVDEWDNDFNLFKLNCATPREKIELNVQLEKEMNDKLNEKMKSAKIELLEEREKSIKQNMEKEEESKMDGVIKTTNQVALQAIQKELNLEAMIRREEVERERREESLMIEKIEAEKKKSDCLMKAIKEREIENQYNVKAKEAEDEVTSIKETASQQVLIRRSQLKNQILAMRKKAQRRKAKLAQQLLNVRTVMAETMGKVYRKGDTSKCSTAMKSDKDKLTYCQVSFPDDYGKMTDCKETDDFCSMCCENEWGDMHVNERQECYKSLCKNSGPSSSGATPANGRWIWQETLS